MIVVPWLWWENALLVIDEAQAAGCAILGSELGGIREMLGEAPTGCTFSYNDANDLADELIVIQRLDRPDL